MLLSTRSRYTRLSHKRHFLAQTPSLTPKSAYPATSSKNFRLRRSKVPLRGTAGCPPAPALGGLCGQPQYSKRASSALPTHPKISKACGAPEEEEKKVFTAKTTRRLLRSTAGFAFLDRAGERATDLLSHSRADKRLAEIGTKRSTAEHEKHGVEQSTASSRAVSKHACARAAVISVSSCGSHLQLDIKIFRLRRCGHAPEARNFLGTRHSEKNGRVDDLYKVYEVEERYDCC